MKRFFIFFPLAVFLTACFFFTSCSKSGPQEKPSKTGNRRSAKSFVDRLILKNGGIIEGKIVQKTPQIVRIDWQNSIVGFSQEEIQSIEEGVDPKKEGAKEGVYVPEFEDKTKKKLVEAWPEGVRNRIRLKNGEIIGGEITKKTGKTFTIRQAVEGGGAVVLELPIDKIERIDLWQPKAISSEEFAALQKKYPELKYVEKGYYNIISSEQDPAELKLYVKTLDQFYHDFLIYFFDLIDTNRSPESLDVVILGTRMEFDQLLKEMGFDGKSYPIGFYSSQAKKLFFFNSRTERGIREGLWGARQFQKAVSKIGEEHDAEFRGADSIRFRGAVEEVSKIGQSYELYLASEAWAQTRGVMRHEGAHQLFHLIGVTPDAIYQGGWLIEGLAIFSEPPSIGDIHEERLMQLRYELEKKDLLPLEFLLNFGRGIDFHKMDAVYTNLSYAESWAFVYFLVNHGYREPFFGYLKDLKNQGPDFNAAADRALLEKHIGKKLKDLEIEFAPFVKRLTNEDVDEKIYQDYRLRIIKSL